MDNQPTVEQRLAALEREVERIKLLLNIPSTGGNWVEARSGSMKDFPEFEEVVRLGREAAKAMDDCIDP